MKLQVTYKTHPHPAPSGHWVTDVIGINGQVVGRGAGHTAEESRQLAAELVSSYTPNSFLADEVFA